VFSPSCCFRSCTDLNPSFDSSIFQFNHRLRSHRSTSPWRRPTLRSSCVKLSPLVLSLFHTIFFVFSLLCSFIILSTRQLQHLLSRYLYWFFLFVFGLCFDRLWFSESSILTSVMKLDYFVTLLCCCWVCSDLNDSCFCFCMNVIVLQI
jgi:hypothetical protein